MERQFFVYILANRPYGTLYVGITNRREKLIEKWHRDWKVNLVQTLNPGWADLYDLIAK